MLSRLLPDRFILWLLGALALGLILPVGGGAAAAVNAATLAAIFALFFLHGVRLPREALKAGLTDWRLHAAILGLTYAAFPIAGLALASLLPGLLPAGLWTGILFLCALPSTVQSSIAYTSMARGNVAGAVAAAAFSNMAGVILTPLLAAAMIGAAGASFSAGAIGRIVLLLLVPFAVGHALRPWLLGTVEARPGLTRAVDKGTILLAVYGAFSAATVAGTWSRLAPAQTATLIGLCLVLLAFVLAASWAVGRPFPRESRAAILFCGSVKSLASGAPMARVLFPGAAAGLVLLPVMVFHIVQLIVCAWIAARLGRKASIREQRPGPG
jgi:sodium/bile acid cotransporter 7